MTTPTTDLHGWTITCRPITFSPAAPPEVRGRTLDRWDAHDPTGRLRMGAWDDRDALQVAVLACIEQDAPTTLTFDDGSQRTMRAVIAETVLGLDAAGDVIARADGIAYALTPCCFTSATGTTWGIACRACYAEVDDYYGGTPGPVVSVVTR